MDLNLQHVHLVLPLHHVGDRRTEGLVNLIDTKILNNSNLVNSITKSKAPLFFLFFKISLS